MKNSIAGPTLIRLLKKKDHGQLIAAVLMLLVIMATLIPLMVMYTQREAIWTVSQSQSTNAFHLAEAASEKAYNALTISTLTWVNLMKGTPPPGYMFDVPYRDLGTGGEYTIGMSSGPASQQATIITISRDDLSKQTRAIKVVYTNSPLGNIAILAGKGASYTGVNMEVEWGAIMSPQSITTNGRLHPQFWSAASIDLDSNGSTPPNCDSPNCCWWHSYNQNIPPLPTIDFSFYKSSAQASGVGPGGCGNHYVSQSSAYSWSCTDTSGQPYYFEVPTLNFGGGHVIGSVIVMGDFATSNGSLGGAAETVPLPNTAWKQYCNDWAYYLTTWDGGAPANFPGLNNTYTSNKTESISPVFHGLLYINGNFTGPTGGGNTDLIFGVIFVQGTVTLNSNSHVKVYYGSDGAANLQTTQILLTRTSWQDTTAGWPASLP